MQSTHIVRECGKSGIWTQVSGATLNPHPGRSSVQFSGLCRADGLFDVSASDGWLLCHAELRRRVQ